MMVARTAKIEIAGDAHDFVSRGGVKLERALEAFGFDPEGCVCLDLGASTGGFTEILLRAGAAKIYAVDVGTGQLHPSLCNHPRIVNLERTHAKDLSRARIPEEIDFIVCDVSFISLEKALPFAMALAARGARLVALVKPQFELGPGKIGKGGLVKASEAELSSLTDSISQWMKEMNWSPAGVIESPIRGGDGNREYLIGAIKPA
ncbi:MAG: TlyA family RNA methyltransferase [Parvularculaceae bacterium]